MGLTEKSSSPPGEGRRWPEQTLWRERDAEHPVILPPPVKAPGEIEFQRYVPAPTDTEQTERLRSILETAVGELSDFDDRADAWRLDRLDDFLEVARVALSESEDRP